MRTLANNRLNLIYMAVLLIFLVWITPGLLMADVEIKVVNSDESVSDTPETTSPSEEADPLEPIENSDATDNPNTEQKTPIETTEKQSIEPTEDAEPKEEENTSTHLKNYLGISGYTEGITTIGIYYERAVGTRLGVFTECTVELGDELQAYWDHPHQNFSEEFVPPVGGTVGFKLYFGKREYKLSGFYLGSSLGATWSEMDQQVHALVRPMLGWRLTFGKKIGFFLDANWGFSYHTFINVDHHYIQAKYGTGSVKALLGFAF